MSRVPHRLQLEGEVVGMLRHTTHLGIVVFSYERDSHRGPG